MLTPTVPRAYGCPALKTALRRHRGAAKSWLSTRGALSTSSTRHNCEGTRTRERGNTLFSLQRL